MLTKYEKNVVDEIAQHAVSPNAVQRLLSAAGKQITGLLTKVQDISWLAPVPEAIDSAVLKALKLSVSGANYLSSDEAILKEFKDRTSIKDYSGIIDCDLELKDSVADTFDASNALIVGAEGAVMGLATSLCEGLPGAQLIIPTIIAADVSASITLLSRHICQIATSYGYSSRDVQNLPHVIAAMAPQSDTSDEGFLAVKATIVEMNKNANKFGKQLTRNALEKVLSNSETPALAKLIEWVAERLGIAITQKELGLLIPVAGAVINGSVNVAFQQAGHTSAKDYFRRIHLFRKYGETVIKPLIDEAVKRKRSERTA